MKNETIFNSSGYKQKCMDYNQLQEQYFKLIKLVKILKNQEVL